MCILRKSHLQMISLRKSHVLRIAFASSRSLTNNHCLQNDFTDVSLTIQYKQLSYQHDKAKCFSFWIFFCKSEIVNGSMCISNNFPLVKNGLNG